MLFSTSSVAGNDWKEQFRIPVREITSVVEALQVTVGTDGRLYFIGPGLIECREATNGRRVWRHEVGGEKGWLGIYLDTFQRGSGVLIKEIIDWPARKAGLRTGDVITKIGEHQTPHGMALIQAVKDLKPGVRLSVDYQREGKQAFTEVSIGARKRPRRFLGEDAQHIYLAFDFQVLSLEKKSGKQRWHVLLEPPPEAQPEILMAGSKFVPKPAWNEGVTGVGMTDKRLILALGGHRLIGIELKTGQPIWSHDSRTAMVERPLLRGQDIIFLKEVGHTIGYLDANTGQQKRQVKLAGAGLTAVFKNLLPLKGGIAIIGQKSLRVLFDEGGQSWKRSIPDETLFSSNGRWILLAHEKLECLDSVTGKQVWSLALGPSDKKRLVCIGDQASVETEKEFLIVDCPTGKRLPTTRNPNSVGLIAAGKGLWARSRQDTQTSVQAVTGNQKMTFEGHLFLFQSSDELLVAATDTELIVMTSGD
jgi:outer membrane protein assembly factor BamB